MRFCSRFISRLSIFVAVLRVETFLAQGRRDSNPQPPVLETGALPIEPLPFAVSHRNRVVGRREDKSYHSRGRYPLAGLLVQRVLALPLAVLGHLDALSVVDLCLLYTSPSPRDRTRSRMPS